MKTPPLSILLSCLLFPLIIFSCSKKTVQDKLNNTNNQDGEVSVWLTTSNQSTLFQKQSTNLSFKETKTVSPSSILVDDSQTFQPIDGFGYCLTGGSAMHIYKMEKSARTALLKELFSTEGNNIGVSYLRVSIGASDLDEKPFSYDDLAPGETDPELNKFSLEPDRKYLIPLLKEIISIDPDIRILGSPWSPPTWMKTNNNSKGGSLKPEWYSSYAKYFVKYIQGMKAEGIRIDAITVQNEPLHPGNNPSLLMVADAQADFVKNHLGPAFRKEGIDTKILIYDHNADRPDYPISILDDPEAKKYIDGSAFHLYAGKIDALSDVHKAHPDKNIYFTEQWIGAPGNFPEDLKWHVRELIIGATRNWSRTVLEWNLAADPQQKPYTDGGCNECLGALTIDGNQVKRNPAYYIIAHASKFIRPGSIRIDSSLPADLPNVAFKTPAGQTVLIVLNNGRETKSFNITSKGKSASASLNSGSVATFIW